MTTHQKWVAAIFLGFIAFGLIVGIPALDPTNLLWIKGIDPLKDYFGWAFYRFGPWMFPIGLNPNYGIEISSSIVYSDSIPLLAILLKPLSPFLTEPFQYLGFWTLACLVLQAIFSLSIIQPYTRSRLIPVLGAALFVFFPAMMARIGLHAALVGHFLILASFYLCIHPKPKSEFLAWLALLNITALVHLYLFVMVFTIWGAHLLDRTIVQKNISIKHGCMQFIATAVSLIVTTYQAGWFAIDAGSTSFIGYGGYGAYNLNLFEPFISGSWSIFYRKYAHTAYAFDGFNYLGLGALLSIICGLPAIYQIRNALFSNLKSNFFLTLGIVLLTLLAISNHVAIGFKTYSFELPTFLLSILGSIRAADRFIWPLLYLAILTSIIAMLRVYSQRQCFVILLVCASLQIADTKEGWGRLHAFLMHSDISKIDWELKDPFWKSAANHYKELRRYPVINQSTWETFAALAADHHMKTDSVQLARFSGKDLWSYQTQLSSNMANGHLNPNALYILNEWKDSGISHNQVATIKFDASKDLLARIDNFIVLAPGWKSCSSCPPLLNKHQELTQFMPITRLNEPILFSNSGLGSKLLASGWSQQEPWGSWSANETSKIFLPLPVNKPSKIVINARALISQTHPSQNIEIRVNQVLAKKASLTKSENNIIEVDIDIDTLSKPFIIIDFSYQNPARPVDIGYKNGDQRLMAISLQSITFR